MSKFLKKLTLSLLLLVLAGGFVLVVNKYNTDTTRGNEPRLVFEEIRQWQIAADATTGEVHPSAYTLTTGFYGDDSGNFNNASYLASNAYSNNGVYASTGFSDKRNEEYATNFRGFNFAAIPDGSVINSVNVYIDRKVDVANGIAQWHSSVWADVTVAAALAPGTTGAIGPDLDYTTSINPTSDAYWNFPLTGTLPTVAQLKGASFGIRAEIVNGNNGTDCEYFIDDIYMVVDYTPPLTVAGVVYLADETTLATSANGGPCDGTTAVVKTVINSGTPSTAVACNGTTAAFSVTTGLPSVAGDTITLYLTSSAKANLVYTSDATADTGMNLYIDRVAVSHLNGTSITIADMTDYDSTTNPTDMLYDAVSGTPNTLTIASGKELHIVQGKTFLPGGSVTTQGGGGLHLAYTSVTGAAANFEANAVAISGNVTIDANTTLTAPSSGGSFTVGGSWTNNGTFTHNSGTVSFNGSAAQTLTGATAWNNLTINNTYATPSDTYDVDPDAVQTVAGTLTVTDGQWTPFAGDDYVNVNIGYTDATINGIMKPDAGITVAGNWTNAGTFTHNSGTVTFDGNASADQTVTTNGQAFYNFTVNNDEATYDDIIISGALDINNTLTITDGNLEFSTNNPNINTAGDVTIGASGAITKGTGTWTFDKAGSQTYTDSTSGVQDIGIVTIGPSTTTTVATVTAMKVTNLTIGADDILDITDDTLEITGSGTPFTITTGGAFTIANSTVKYTSFSDIYITETDYHNLKLGPGL